MRLKNKTHFIETKEKGSCSFCNSFFIVKRILVNAILLICIYSLYTYLGLRPLQILIIAPFFTSSLSAFLMVVMLIFGSVQDILFCHLDQLFLNYVIGLFEVTTDYHLAVSDINALNAVRSLRRLNYSNFH